jgi:hypothetical protein
VWHNDVESFQDSSFVYCDAQVCYGTDVEHRSLMNRSGICDELSVVIFCFVHTAVLRITRGSQEPVIAHLDQSCFQ